MCRDGGSESPRPKFGIAAATLAPAVQRERRGVAAAARIGELRAADDARANERLRQWLVLIWTQIGSDGS